MEDIEKKIKEIDDAIRIAENPLNTAPGGEIAGRGYVVDRLNEYKELLKEQKAYEWHFIKFREPTDEEKEYYKDEYGEYNEGDADNILMLENAPADGEEVLLWTWCGFTVDTYNDGMFEGAGEIEEGMAWRYLPEEPKAGEKE